MLAVLFTLVFIEESKKPRPEDGALKVAPGGGGTGYPQRG